MSKVIFFITLFLASFNLSAENNERLLFENIFSRWTEAFNQKELTKACSLFSKSVVADYRGVPQKNYDTICNGFREIFQQNDRLYHYRFKLHKVYRAKDLAVVRITWYLTVYENQKLISTTQDEGIDILEKNKQGQWQIINYLAYEKET